LVLCHCNVRGMREERVAMGLEEYSGTVERGHGE
jgi:hypothetical protein